MNVSSKTKTERTISFDLGEITLCEETATVCFRDILATADPVKVREFGKVLEDIAVTMETCGGGK
jgi:hypothetical protein